MYMFIYKYNDVFIILKMNKKYKNVRTNQETIWYLIQRNFGVEKI